MNHTLIFYCIETLLQSTYMLNLRICYPLFFEGTNRITQAVLGAHEGGIFSICVLKDGIILTGGKDRRIVEWGPAYNRTGLEHEVSQVISQ